jgi:hypothetical protein
MHTPILVNIHPKDLSIQFYIASLQPVALPIKLPDRAVSVAANLTGRVRLLSPGPDGEPAYQVCEGGGQKGLKHVMTGGQ